MMGGSLTHPPETPRMNAPAYSVVHNTEAHRFEVTLEGHLGKAEYTPWPGGLRMTHTEVPPALEGRGIAAALVRAAVDHARANALKIDPQCSYVRSYLERHPETHDLRA